MQKPYRHTLNTRHHNRLVNSCEATGNGPCVGYKQPAMQIYVT